MPCPKGSDWQLSHTLTEEWCAACEGLCNPPGCSPRSHPLIMLVPELATWWSGWGIHHSRAGVGFVATGTEWLSCCQRYGLPHFHAQLQCGVGGAGTLGWEVHQQKSLALPKHIYLIYTQQIFNLDLPWEYTLSTTMVGSGPGLIQSYGEEWAGTGVFAPLGLRNAARWQLPVQGSLCHDWHTQTPWYWVQLSAALLSVSAVLPLANRACLLHAVPQDLGNWLGLKLLAALDEDPPMQDFSLPFRFFSVRSLMLCFFSLCPTLLGGDFSCSFGCIGVLQSVSNWFSMRTILYVDVSDVSGGGG